MLRRRQQLGAGRQQRRDCGWSVQPGRPGPARRGLQAQVDAVEPALAAEQLLGRGDVHHQQIGQGVVVAARAAGAGGLDEADELERSRLAAGPYREAVADAQAKLGGRGVREQAGAAAQEQRREVGGPGPVGNAALAPRAACALGAARASRAFRERVDPEQVEQARRSAGWPCAVRST